MSTVGVDDGRIYIDNKTEFTFEKLYIKYGNREEKIIEVKKLKPKPKAAEFNRLFFSVHARHFSGSKQYEIYHYDSDNKIHRCVIENTHKKNYAIRIEIIGVRENGGLEIRADLNYDYTKLV